MPSVRGFLDRVNPWHTKGESISHSYPRTKKINRPGRGDHLLDHNHTLKLIHPFPLVAAAAPPPPPITTRTALLLLGLYALIYVLPFYLSKLTRPSAELSRDAPSVIKARIRSVAMSCVICCLCTYAILVHDAHAAYPEALHLMGLWPLALVDSSRALFLTAALFAGPLFKYILVDGGAREWRKLQPVKELWQEWTVWRNIVAVREAVSPF